MGVRIIGEASHYAQAVPTWSGAALCGIRPGRYGGGSQGRRASVPRFTVLFDGTAGKEGLAAALPANEAWLDPTVMVHPGETQVAINAMYTGAGSCKVYGAMLPADYAQKVVGSEGAALVTEATGKWEEIATLLPNVAANLFGTDGINYTLYRFEFLTSSQAGSVVLTSV